MLIVTVDLRRRGVLYDSPMVDTIQKDLVPDLWFYHWEMGRVSDQEAE